MRKIIICTATISIGSFMFLSCDFDGENINGNGNLKSETRNVGTAAKINLIGGMDVFVNSGNPAVKVEGDENILQFIQTEMHDGWLEVRTRDHTNIHSKHPVKVYITTPSLTDLRVNGSGNITCNDKFSSVNSMSFDISGSGNITAEVNAPEVNAGITGSGNMYVKGETRNAKIHITGSGNYESPELKAENADVEIAGSGDADLFAENDLKATIAGSGDVKYRGNAEVQKHVAGSGSVIKQP